MKKFLLPFLGVLLITSSLFAASPRTWHKSGTATTTAASITVGGSSTFGPASICVRNTDATNNLVFALNQTAVAADNSEGILLTIASPEKCISFSNQNVSNAMTISVVAVADTATYVANAVSSR